MKKTKKNLLCLSISSLALVLMIQGVAAKSNLSVNQDLNGTEVCATRIEAFGHDAASAKITEKKLSKIKKDALAVTKKSPAGYKTNTVPKTESIESKKSFKQDIGISKTGSSTEKVNKEKETSAITKSVSLDLNDTETKQFIAPGIYYNAEKEILYDPNGMGLLYTGFEYDLKQKIFYSSMNPWQRDFGFIKLYDDAAPLTNMFYDTVRLKFNYNEIDWMIQLWKGQYGITSGGEIGVYQKSPNSLWEKYDCASDENRLVMSFDLYKNGELYFSREEQLHWWLTGFALGDVTAYKELTLKAAITMKDEAMKTAFIGALNSQGFSEGTNYSVDGLKIRVNW